jgi:hypothetical protein
VADYGSADWLHEQRERPFADALRMAIRSGNNSHRLPAIAEKLIEKAEQGDLQAIRKIADRLDGKATQVIDRGDVPLEAMTDQQLMTIIRGGSREPVDEPSYPMICGPSQAKRTAK